LKLWAILWKEHTGKRTSGVYNFAYGIAAKMVFCEKFIRVCNDLKPNSTNTPIWMKAARNHEAITAKGQT